MIVAFDVDNTLLQLDEQGNIVTNEDVRALLVAVWKLGLADIVVWSGGGADYAEYATRDCGIRHMVWAYWGKNDGRPDVAIDDQSVVLGRVNLKLAGDIEATPWMGIGQDNANI